MKKLFIQSASLPAELKKGIAQITDLYPMRFTENSRGLSVSFRKISSDHEGYLDISNTKGETVITYDSKSSAFRALGILLGQTASDTLKNITEHTDFSMLGIMIDASRNGVTSIPALKQILSRLALMGINVCMMYAEDTYEIPGEPFFGYMRGAYTKAEMKEADQFAFNLGIEMFPCIQTLAHLEQILKWPVYKELQDTDYILMPEDPKTYRLIGKMIKASSAPFRSSRIHIGMDEAWALGQGRYKDRHGEVRRFDIMNRHLNKVRSLCRKLKLDPMIWSDMYFRLGSKNGQYYEWDWKVPRDVIKDIPRDVQLVYWDYYHCEYEFYTKMIERHRKLGSEPLVAPGAWTWNHFWASVPFAENTLSPCMRACRDQKIREVFITAWGDDGMECDLFSALPACQYFAEYGYNSTVSRKKLESNFRGSCNSSYAAWRKASYIDYPPEQKKPEETNLNASKFLLYDDIFLGLWSKQLRHGRIEQHYGKLAEYLSTEAKTTPESARLKFPAQLARVISRKITLRDKLVQAYRENKKSRLSKLLDQDVKQLRKDVDTLWKTHRDMWLSTYKPFGLEVIEMRYGVIRTRLESLSDRLQHYLGGKIDSIPEFEVKLRKAYPSKPGQIQGAWSHRTIVSPSKIV